MKIVGALLGVVSLILMLIGFIPLLGWFNWFMIPFATISLIVSAITSSRSGQTMSVVAIIFGMMRLIFGGGLL